MKILLVGEGAREHIIAEKLVEAGALLSAVCKRNHPGIRNLCNSSKGKFFSGDVTAKAIEKAIEESKPDLGFVSPDGLLAEGLSDVFSAKGVPVASPSKSASRLEWDKSFARKLMEAYNVPGCPVFGIFTDFDKASQFIDRVGEVAVKPAGLTGGKGVKVSGIHLADANQAKQYVKELLAQKHGGLAEVVIEEKLSGEEFTLQVFTDGKTVLPMPLVQDHKAAFVDDKGPNTGGMGSYSTQNHLLPFVTVSDYEKALNIINQILSAYKKEAGEVFKGILYGQFMLTKEGVKVVEFNSRFGDPEAINVLSVLKSSLSELLMKIAEGSLRSRDAEFFRRATVCKYLVPEGYPDSPARDQEITIINPSEKFYFASVYEQDGKVYTTSSRAIAVIATDLDFYSAEKKVEECILKSFKGKLYHRHDIGTKRLIQKKLDKLASLGIL